VSRIRTAIVEGSPVYKLVLALALAFAAIAVTTAMLMSTGMPAPGSAADDTAVIAVLAGLLP
jgi:hypothetical protein